jgi:oligopeptide/dipeptide ABC transporter ATP-binding protein
MTTTTVGPNAPAPGPQQPQTLLEVSGLRVVFGGAGSPWSRRGGHAAVDGVDLAVDRGRTLGLIGESGSGKTTVCKTLAGLVRPAAGTALLDGEDLFTGRRRSRAVTRKVQMIFQDPFSSLDPGLRAVELVREPLRIHRVGSPAQQRERVAELLDLVGLSSAYLTRFPHQMSGGQLQRVAVARALALEPELLLADEPLSALDVSIQAQVSNLLMGVQRDLGVSFLFIGHDLAAVRRLSDSVAVMFGGRIMEAGPATDVYDAPRHPYTLALMSAVPEPSTVQGRSRIVVRGTSERGRPGGCRYRSRCWLYQNLGRPPRCEEEEPEVSFQGERGAACHYADQVSDQPQYGEVLANAGLA